MSTVYIALLRGINVSGQKLIKMAALRQELAGPALQDLRTYIQSGNLVFRSDRPAPELVPHIRARILAAFGFNVPTLVLPLAELQAILARSPLSLPEDADEKRLYFTLLEGEPTAKAVEKLYALAPPNEHIRVQGQVAYLYYPDGYGRAKINNNVVEKTLGLTGTTRNLRTLRKLVNLAGELPPS